MSYINNSIEILKNANQPLPITEIVNRLPEHVKKGRDRKRLRASLATALFRDVKKGKYSKLMRVSKGVIGLRKWYYPDEKPIVAIARGRRSNNIFSWDISERSVTAIYRKENPYKHNCPLPHFRMICSHILSVLSEDDSILTSGRLVDQLNGTEIVYGHVFRKGAETYKIHLVLDILVHEGLLIKNRTPSGSYSLGQGSSRLSKWIDNISVNE